VTKRHIPASERTSGENPGRGHSVGNSCLEKGADIKGKKERVSIRGKRRTGTRAREKGREGKDNSRNDGELTLEFSTRGKRRSLQVAKVVGKKGGNL